MGGGCSRRWCVAYASTGPFCHKYRHTGISCQPDVVGLLQLSSRWNGTLLPRLTAVVLDELAPLSIGKMGWTTRTHTFALHTYAHLNQAPDAAHGNEFRRCLRLMITRFMRCDMLPATNRSTRLCEKTR